MSLDIRQKINEYIKNYPEYQLYRETELISIMVKEGVLSSSEVYAAMNSSAFGTGFADINVDSFTPIKPKSRTPETYTQMQKITAQSYIAQILFQQALELYQIYWDTANNRSIGNEGMMELQEAGAFLVKHLNLDKIFGISEPETRNSIYKKVNQFINDTVKMTNGSKEEFEKLYSRYFNKTPDYSSVINYIENVKEIDSYSRLNLDILESKSVETVEENLKRFEEFNKDLTSNKISKLVQDWSGSTLNGSGMVDLAFNLALLYGTGGFSATSKGSMTLGQAVQEATNSALTQIGTKKSTSDIISKMTGITTTQMTNAAVTSAGFHITKIIDVVKDGKVTKEDCAHLQESSISLFKFGYIGGALSGPLGAKVGELTSRMLNSEPLITKVLQTGISNKPTPMVNILQVLSEHSNAIKTITKFGTEFSINAGYIAKVDNISLEEAIARLGEIDAVSKMVIALMGGKNLSFLTPEKVQKINTELSGYKVKINIFKGQKVYEVTDKDENTVNLANEKELMMFIIDKGLCTNDNIIHKAKIKYTKRTENIASENKTKPITIQETKNLFSNNQIDTSNFLYKSMLEILTKVPKDKQTINLSPELTDKDYKLITELMNLHDGKHLATWFETRDGIPNIQKLALFARILDFTHQTSNFLSFDLNQWDIAVEGIIKKDKKFLPYILEYKLDSTEINNACHNNNNPRNIQQKIETIDQFLNLFVVKLDFTGYRGERTYNILQSIEYENDDSSKVKYISKKYNINKPNNLKEAIENFTLKLEEHYDETLMNEFANDVLIGAKLPQARFLSVAMSPVIIESYAKKIFWEKFIIPAGIKGASIESYNVESKAEAEFLAQRNLDIIITGARYDINSHRWVFKGKVQLHKVETPSK